MPPELLAGPAHPVTNLRGLGSPFGILEKLLDVSHPVGPLAEAFTRDRSASSARDPIGHPVEGIVPPAAPATATATAILALPTLLALLVLLALSLAPLTLTLLTSLALSLTLLALLALTLALLALRLTLLALLALTLALLALRLTLLALLALTLALLTLLALTLALLTLLALTLALLAFLTLSLPLLALLPPLALLTLRLLLLASLTLTLARFAFLSLLALSLPRLFPLCWSLALRLSPLTLPLISQARSLAGLSGSSGIVLGQVLASLWRGFAGYPIRRRLGVFPQTRRRADAGSLLHVTSSSPRNLAIDLVGEVVQLALGTA